MIFTQNVELHFPVVAGLVEPYNRATAEALQHGGKEATGVVARGLVARDGTKVSPAMALCEVTTSIDSLSQSTFVRYWISHSRRPHCCHFRSLSYLIANVLQRALKRAPDTSYSPVWHVLLRENVQASKRTSSSDTVEQSVPGWLRAAKLALFRVAR